MAIDTKVEVKVPKRSGFDKSHQNLLTTKVGTLTPLLVDEVIPNSVVDLDAAISASLPPLASDTFMRCDLKAEAFFVPHRILYGGYEDWLCGNQVYDAEAGEWKDVGLPTVTYPVGGTTSALTESNWKLFTGPGTLLDYLGVKIEKPASGVAHTYTVAVNPFPVLAYHKIYDDWYRNTKVQTPVFLRPTVANNSAGQPYAWFNSPFISIDTSSVSGARWDFSENGPDDSVALGELRQRNFGMDYFTTATPNPQDGVENKVHIDTQNDFSISALRAANSLQQFAERNNLAGNRMQDYVKAHFGGDLSSGVAQRSIYLGSASYSVYSKGISQTAEVASGATNNPFSSVGTQYGRGFASGNGKLIDHFVAAEPGVIMVLVSLVPKVTYATGKSRLMSRFRGGMDASQTDLADPLLQNIGNQPIFVSELYSAKANSASGSSGTSEVFGYTQRYAEWKTMQDEVHGLLRDGESLQSFALQRSFGSAPQIGTGFLQIPTNYLDQVAAVNGDISKYGCWIDSFLSYKVSMPLAEYSIPSLQDPAYEHGEDVKIDIRGSRL